MLVATKLWVSCGWILQVGVPFRKYIKRSDKPIFKKLPISVIIQKNCGNYITGIQSAYRVNTQETIYTHKQNSLSYSKELSLQAN